MISIRRQHSAKRQGLRMESLERRQMMAGDVSHNFLAPQDVNDDARVTPLDALMVINFINDQNPDSDRADDSANRRGMLDVNDDTRVTPLDALQIVNGLNRSSVTPETALPVGQVREAYFVGAAGIRGRIEFEGEDGDAELNVRLRDAEASTSYEVFLNDLALGILEVDSRGRGELALSQGDDRERRGQLPIDFDGLQVGDRFVIDGIIDTMLGSEHSGGQDSSGQDDEDDDRPGDESDDDRGNSLELSASFSQTGGILPSAEYEIDLRRGVMVREFEVEIERGNPGESLGVSVDGVMVGTLTVDDRGKAKLKFSTAPRDADELVMPAEFPQLAEDSVIRVGTAAGTFRRVTDHD
ncbi:dockerin type I domain-containing protein [Planctomycetaceae bacterium SH139]